MTCEPLVGDGATAFTGQDKRANLSGWRSLGFSQVQGAAVLVGSIISMAAAIAVLPQLVSPPPASPSAQDMSWAFGDYKVLVGLVISPLGRVQDCKVITSNMSPDRETKFCDKIAMRPFSSALGVDGKPVYSKVEAFFMSSDKGEGSRLPISDVDLAVEHIPTGLPIHPRTELALTVDAQGHVQSCNVTQSSGAPALDAVACKAGVETADISPVKDAQGNPTVSVESLVVSFGAYTDFIAKQDAHYAAFGVAGPYFPDRAARNGVGGYADLVCIADQSGKLTNCSVDEESPLDFGFGSAALHMANQQWIRVAPGAQRPVLVRVDFQLPGVRR